MKVFHLSDGENILKREAGCFCRTRVLGESVSLNNNKENNCIYDHDGDDDVQSIQIK